MSDGLVLGTVTSLDLISSAEENTKRALIEGKFNNKAVSRNDLEHDKHWCLVSHGGNGASSDDNFFRFANPAITQACTFRKFAVSIRVVGDGKGTHHECQLQLEKASIVAGIPSYGAPTILIPFASLAFDVLDPGLDVVALRVVAYTFATLKSLAADEEVRVRFALVNSASKISHVDVVCNLQTRLE